MSESPTTLSRGEPAAGKLAFLGLGLVTLATLMEEILLTRIFSVTMWYHYAFVAVSIAMFGMTVGALLVYLHPHRFTPERARTQLAQFSLLFSASIVISFLTQLSLPFSTDRASLHSVVGLYTILFTYVVVAVPFVFSGTCVCLALTRFPRQVSRLYAADLAGAAVGCALLVGVLKITDGPTGIIVVAALAGAGSVCFAAHAAVRSLLRRALAVTVVLGVAAAGHTVLVHRQAPVLRLMWVKQAREDPPRYEKWNSFSRLRVIGDPDVSQPPFGWGLSTTLPPDRRARWVTLDIDATAGTPLTAFHGDVKAVDFLKYDITNVAHFLRPHSRVLVVGSGGGRDLLSALVFEQRSVLGVEMNGDILDIANRRFGDFTGHLDRDPRVELVNDEARSYIARQAGRFDILQISLIDTWAATAAGAFVLAENSLYTTEAWRIFLSHLTPRGVLTVSRWYSADNPVEAYRLVSLATEALLEMGVKNPRAHLLLLRHTWPVPPGTTRPHGVGTILVSASPFSLGDTAAAEALARRRQFEIALSPTSTLDETLSRIASGQGLRQFTSHYPLDITPPTDDRPFFFHTLRFRDALSRRLLTQPVQANMRAVSILGVLLVVVIVLTLLCIIVPLVQATERSTLRGAGPLLLFFACIGLGFMFIEMSQMQRLIVFLGHPTYGLSVVLFALLLSSGLGSYATEWLTRRGLARAALTSLLVLLVALVAFGLATPLLLHRFQAWSTPWRILLSVAMLFPVGLLMGMPFPLGMKLAWRRSRVLTPWLWGVNGATSVCASVLAVVVAMSAGIAASFWVGSGCYLLALGAFARAGRGAEPSRAGETVVANAAR